MSDIDVSVVIAVKNEQIFVESAILSILTQVGVNFEVIAVDDGSDDNTFAILSRIAQDHPNFQLFRNPKQGKCSAFNFGVSQATAQFVCLFAGDDIMPEGSLAARWAAIKDYSLSVPVVGLCKLITLSDIKRFDGQLVPRRPGRGGFTGVSYLMNRSALEKIFPVPETLPNEDTWMEIAITNFPGWQIVHSDIVGCAWRVHDGNSINMLVGFDDYNKKLKPRMQAIPLFYEKHGAELLEENRRWLRGKIECEKNRAEGNIVGIILSQVGFVEKLRALSASNRVFYGLRKQLFSLLSGW